jgi:hypothetical protein
LPLTGAQRDEAVSRLAELPLDVAAKRRGLRFGSANDGASGGSFGNVIPFP